MGDIEHILINGLNQNIAELMEENNRLRAEVARLKAKNVQLKKQLCNYQLAEIGSKLVEEMEDG